MQKSIPPSPPSSPPDFPNQVPSSSSQEQEEEHLVTFSPNDPSDPRNFPPWRKWLIVASITLVDLTVSFGASGYSPATSKLTEHFGVSAEIGTLGLSLYVLGLALGPMSLGPLSEYYGRTPLYILPYGTFLLFLIGTAVVQSIEAFLVLRFFSGLFASVTIANFGGTIADLWPRESVGPAMYVFLWAAVCGSPMGFFLMSFVAEGHGWRTVFWALVGICGGSWVLMVLTLLPFNNETRHSVLLRRKAEKLNKREGSGGRYVVTEEMKAKDLRQLFAVTLSRPFRFLGTESIVVFCALYNGFLYGLSFLFNGAFTLVYGEMGYGFDIRGVGLTFLGLVVGISLGPFVSILQEKHYQKAIRMEEEVMNEEGGTLKVKYKPEARVQQGKVAGITLPISLFWFAWTSPPEYDIHW